MSSPSHATGQTVPGPSNKDSLESPSSAAHGARLPGVLPSPGSNSTAGPIPPAGHPDLQGASPGAIHFPFASHGSLGVPFSGPSAIPPPLGVPTPFAWPLGAAPFPYAPSPGQPALSPSFPAPRAAPQPPAAPLPATPQKSDAHQDADAGSLGRPTDRDLGDAAPVQRAHFAQPPPSLGFGGLPPGVPFFATPDAALQGSPLVPFPQGISPAWHPNAAALLGTPGSTFQGVPAHGLTADGFAASQSSLASPPGQWGSPQLKASFPLAPNMSPLPFFGGQLPPIVPFGPAAGFVPPSGQGEWSEEVAARQKSYTEFLEAQRAKLLAQQHEGGGSQSPYFGSLGGLPSPLYTGDLNQRSAPSPAPVKERSNSQTFADRMYYSVIARQKETKSQRWQKYVREENARKLTKEDQDASACRLHDRDASRLRDFAFRRDLYLSLKEGEPKSINSDDEAAMLNRVFYKNKERTQEVNSQLSQKYLKPLRKKVVLTKERQENLNKRLFYEQRERAKMAEQLLNEKYLK